MASREPIELVFGDAKYKIRPLTIDQVERIEAIFLPRNPPLTNVQTAREAIKVAMSRDHAAVDIGELDCDVQKLPGQLSQILRLGGFETPGEAPAAAAANASTGEVSEGALQPSADGDPINSAISSGGPSSS